MDSATAVNTSAAISLLGFAAIIFLLLFLIARWKWHVFFALLIPILLFGILPGIQQNNFIDAFENGFGNTLGSIGVVIVLGSIIAEALKHTGAIQVITRSMVNLVGSQRMPLALTLTGFIIGVAIFSDVAYVILNPLVHSAAKTMGVSIAVMSTGLVGAAIDPCHRATDTRATCSRSAGRRRHREDHHLWQHRLPVWFIGLLGVGSTVCRSARQHTAE